MLYDVGAACRRIAHNADGVYNTVIDSAVSIRN